MANKIEAIITQFVKDSKATGSIYPYDQAKNEYNVGELEARLAEIGVSAPIALKESIGLLTSPSKYFIELTSIMVEKEHVSNLVKMVISENGRYTGFDLSQIKKDLEAIGYNKEQAVSIVDNVVDKLNIGSLNINKRYFQIRKNPQLSHQDAVLAFTNYLVSAIIEIKQKERAEREAQEEAGRKTEEPTNPIGQLTGAVFNAFATLVNQGRGQGGHNR
jgi:hypothetical protein